ncbi:MAG: glycoside hydrolase family 127 protein [Treponema sp.]|nr:glycoside hydrolase family 127 protein [Treponema sp.]
MSKKFDSEVKRLTNIKAFDLADVKLEDEYFLDITQKDINFLNTFDADRLLYNFRLTAGLPNKASGPYSGWENTRIGGHTLGHYLAAAAQGIAGGYGDCKGRDSVSLRERLALLINGLAECQAASGRDERCKPGFIFGATMADPSKPELQFDKLEEGNQADTWVPWYTMHKIMNGLVEVAKLVDGETGSRALDLAEKLGEWMYNRTSRWDEETRKRVLSVEYGGMNDCLYELYKCAKAAGYEQVEHFKQVAHTFDEEYLFKEILTAPAVKGKDANILNNRHANTTIPKFVGAINRCLTLKEEGDPASEAEQKQYLEYCKAFWNLVTQHHTYITGGNSECEHFGKDDILDAERSNTNCETCNVHNMLKLTRALFMLTGERKYADYYENTFINSILASVNRETGMTTYFQPMATGCFKTYCNPDVNKNYFWCCTGTGLENFTKLGDSIYFYGEDEGGKPRLFVNQYFSSEVSWKARGIKLSQKSDIPMGEAVTFTVEALEGGEADDFTLALRIPEWCCAKPSLLINDADADVKDFTEQDGYLLVSRKWQTGDTITLTLPMEIKAYTLPDNPKSAAFKYGPVVLAAELGRDDKMKLRQVGVQCDVCANKIIRGLEFPLNGNYGGTNNLKPLAPEYIKIKNAESTEAFLSDINSHFEREAGSLNFILHDIEWGEDGELKFSPYYLINNQRYGIYWLYVSELPKQTEANEAEKELAKYTFIEGIGVGYGAQTEGNETTAPYMQETGSGSVGNAGELTRYAKAGGSFSYMFKVLPDAGKRIYLDCTFLKADEGKEIIIKSGDTLIADYTLSYDGNDEKFIKSFELPATLTEGQNEIRITFTGKPGSESARLAAPVSTSWK